MNTPFFIGVAGGTAAGKTAVSKMISARCGPDVPVVSLDDFYKEVPEGAGETHDWDNPNSFDWACLHACMLKWKRGQSAQVPFHDFTNYRRIDLHTTIEASPVMIFEGIHMLHDEVINELLDLKIYVDCDSDVALARRILRDTSERKYSLTLVLERYMKYVKPAYDLWIYPSRRNADIIIPNTETKSLRDHKGIDLLVLYVLSKCKEIIEKNQ